MQCFSADGENDSDILSIIGASAALHDFGDSVPWPHRRVRVAGSTASSRESNPCGESGKRILISIYCAVRDKMMIDSTQRQENEISDNADMIRRHEGGPCGVREAH